MKYIDARQRVRVCIPGTDRVVEIDTPIANIRKKGRAYTGEFRTHDGQTQKVWRTMGNSTWRLLS